MLLSRFCSELYELLPDSREVLKAAGGAAVWCRQNGINTRSGPAETPGLETLWLSRADALEVDALVWLPWLLLQSRKNYRHPILLRDQKVLMNPYFTRWVLRQRGTTEQPVAGALIRDHFVQAAARSSDVGKSL